MGPAMLLALGISGLSNRDRRDTTFRARRRSVLRPSLPSPVLSTASINFFVFVSGAEQTAFDYRDRIIIISGAFFAAWRRTKSRPQPAYLPPGCGRRFSAQR